MADYLDELDHRTDAAAQLDDAERGAPHGGREELDRV